MIARAAQRLRQLRAARLDRRMAELALARAECDARRGDLAGARRSLVERQGVADSLADWRSSARIEVQELPWLLDRLELIAAQLLEDEQAVAAAMEGLRAAENGVAERQRALVRANVRLAAADHLLGTVRIRERRTVSAREEDVADDLQCVGAPRP